MRNTEDEKRENTRENRRSSRDDRDDYHRSERKKIKGRGRMHYKPQFSRSRSRSRTPPHWRAEERKTLTLKDYEKKKKEMKKRDEEIERRAEERRKRHEEQERKAREKKMEEEILKKRDEERRAKEEQQKVRIFLTDHLLYSCQKYQNIYRVSYMDFMDSKELLNYGYISQCSII